MALFGKRKNGIDFPPKLPTPASVLKEKLRQLAIHGIEQKASPVQELKDYIQSELAHVSYIRESLRTQTPQNWVDAEDMREQIDEYENSLHALDNTDFNPDTNFSEILDNVVDIESKKGKVDSLLKKTDVSERSSISESLPELFLTPEVEVVDPDQNNSKLGKDPVDLHKSETLDSTPLVESASVETATIPQRRISDEEKKRIQIERYTERESKATAFAERFGVSAERKAMLEAEREFEEAITELHRNTWKVGKNIPTEVQEKYDNARLAWRNALALAVRDASKQDIIAARFIGVRDTALRAEAARARARETALEEKKQTGVGEALAWMNRAGKGALKVGVGAAGIYSEASKKVGILGGVLTKGIINKYEKVTGEEIDQEKKDAIILRARRIVGSAAIISAIVAATGGVAALPIGVGFAVKVARGAGGVAIGGTVGGAVASLQDATLGKLIKKQDALRKESFDKEFKDKQHIGALVDAASVDVMNDEARTFAKGTRSARAARVARYEKTRATVEAGAAALAGGLATLELNHVLLPEVAHIEAVQQAGQHLESAGDNSGIITTGRLPELATPSDQFNDFEQPWKPDVSVLVQDPNSVNGLDFRMTSGAVAIPGDTSVLTTPPDSGPILPQHSDFPPESRAEHVAAQRDAISKIQKLAENQPKATAPSTADTNASLKEGAQATAPAVAANEGAEAASGQVQEAVQKVTSSEVPAANSKLAELIQNARNGSSHFEGIKTSPGEDLNAIYNSPENLQQHLTPTDAPAAEVSVTDNPIAEPVTPAPDASAASTEHFVAPEKMPEAQGISESITHSAPVEGSAVSTEVNIHAFPPIESVTDHSSNLGGLDQHVGSSPDASVHAPDVPGTPELLPTYTNSHGAFIDPNKPMLQAWRIPGTKITLPVIYGADDATRAAAADEYITKNPSVPYVLTTHTNKITGVVELQKHQIGMFGKPGIPVGGVYNETTGQALPVPDPKDFIKMK